MARVSREVQERVAELIDALPDDLKKTCGLCNRTLYDQLVSIATQADAPQKTVCDIFAGIYNELKAKHDHVSGRAFLERIKWIDRVNKRDLSGGTSEDRKCEIDRSAEKQPAEAGCNLCGDSHQINREDTGEPGAEVPQIHDDRENLLESEEPAGPVMEAQDPDVGVQGSEEPVATTCTEPYPNTRSKPDPYEALVELWRSKQYTAEDVYQVFLTELLARFSPDDVDAYRREAAVSLDDLSLVIGNTVRQNGGLSPEDFHHVIRHGLEVYGGWSTKRTDTAIGYAPLTSEQRAAGDF